MESCYEFNRIQVASPIQPEIVAQFRWNGGGPGEYIGFLTGVSQDTRSTVET